MRVVAELQVRMRILSGQGKGEGGTLGCVRGRRRRRGPEKEVEEGGTSELEKRCQLEPQEEREEWQVGGGRRSWMA